MVGHGLGTLKLQEASNTTPFHKHFINQPAFDWGLLIGRGDIYFQLQNICRPFTVEVPEHLHWILTTTRGRREGKNANCLDIACKTAQLIATWCAHATHCSTDCHMVRPRSSLRMLTDCHVVHPRSSLRMLTDCHVVRPRSSLRMLTDCHVVRPRSSLIATWCAHAAHCTCSLIATWCAHAAHCACSLIATWCAHAAHCACSLIATWCAHAVHCACHMVRPRSSLHMLRPRLKVQPEP